MRILWDETKNRSNQRKHGLAFEDATTLFEISHEYLEIFDGDHSGEEDRFIAIGPIQQGVIVVIFCEPGEEMIRIISARKATQREHQLYVAYIKGRQL